MRLRMPPRWYQKLALILALLYLLYAALAALLVATWGPHLLANQLQQLTGKMAHVTKLRFNPFTNLLTASDFTLNGASGTIIGLEHLSVDVQLLPLVKGEIYLRELTLDAPFVHLVRLADGSFNLAHLLKPSPDATTPPKTTEESGGFALTPVIAHLQVRAGTLRFSDRSFKPAKSLSLTQFGFNAENVAILAGKKFVYQAALDLPSAGHISVTGKVRAEPLSLTADLGIKHLSLKLMSPWLQQLSGLAIDAGSLGSDVTLHFSDAAWRVAGAANIASFKLLGTDGLPLVAVDALGLHQIDVEQQGDKLKANAKLAIKAARLQAADGKPLLAIKSLTAPQLSFTQTGSNRQASGALKIDGWQTFDSNNKPLLGITQLVASDVTFEQQANKLQAAAQLAANGVTLDGDNAKPLATLDKLAVKDVTLAQSPQGMTLTAGVALSDWQWLKADGKQLLAVKSLVASGFKLDNEHHAIKLDKLAVKGLEGSFKVLPDGKTTLDQQQARIDAVTKRLPDFRRELAASGAADTTESAPVSWQYRLGKFTLDARKLYLLDRSVTPAYRLYAAPLAMSAGPINSRGGKVPLLMTAKLGGYAPLRVEGEVSPFGKKVKANLDVSLNGYDMTHLSPYTGRYVAHLVSKGQLNVLSNISLDASILSSQSQIDANHFYLGKGVKSKDAINAPVSFGLSILRDRHGNISLPLSVGGDLNDPSVSVHGLILQALLNILTRAATAPLSLLSLLSGGVNLDHVSFDAGSPKLTQQQLTALAGVAKVLKQRPDLMLGLSGSSNAADAAFLKHKGVAGKALVSQLTTLAKYRGQALKVALVQHYHILAKRLYLEQARPTGKVAGVVLSALNK